MCAHQVLDTAGLKEQSMIPDHSALNELSVAAAQHARSVAPGKGIGGCAKSTACTQDVRITLENQSFEVLHACAHIRF